MQEIRLTDIEGIKIGHEQDLYAATGCTVILCEEGATAGVDVRGGAPGTRETDLLDPVNLVEKVHAVLLSGGSAFGLDAAAGVMQYLEERKIGFDVGVTTVPIVTAAVLFDLMMGDHRIRPDKAMGYKACQNAFQQDYREGTVGAGTGAAIGKYLGMSHAMKGGIGVFCIQVGALQIGAVVAVNCMGDVIDPKNGEIIAGILKEDKSGLGNTEEIMLRNYKEKKNLFHGNTTIGAVITNAKLTKSQANKIASVAHNGYARAIRPAHTMVDGDTIFVMATGKEEADINVVGLLAAKVVEEAVLRGVRKAESLHNIPSLSSIG
ncbi:L-aminopeptidase/D-esterase [Geosporobacter subterraneus DSM 17957]|uniref:L-aminopeptidase/D-esterase n=1 Tax=Geosporobacter subterraneus DSM 17957 TaxID=1121919 RepID=A0A1M6H741_9FIRM|nr:P1 family peptidase [Geosporobacter subterraneus]SHJ18061.1 L-aminopeptidase/D-esterase [Geosporobacter subterraneus DSM 17957]